MQKTVLIILTYNQLEQATKPCLNSLYQHTNENIFDLIIIDNASTDGTVEYIRNFAKKHKNATIIENSKNLGYAGGNNIGINFIKDKNYEYVGLLNNDILFTPNWLEKTIKGFEFDETIGMISPRNNEKCNLTDKNYLNGYANYLKKFKKPLKYVITPFFSCVIMKKELTDRVGLFDENFNPAFWEDNDYSFRAMYLGYGLAYINSVFIFHNHSTTSSKVKPEIFAKNKEYFFKKHPLGKWVWEHKRTNIINDIRRYILEGQE